MLKIKEKHKTLCVNGRFVPASCYNSCNSNTSPREYYIRARGHSENKNQSAQPLSPLTSFVVSLKVTLDYRLDTGPNEEFADRPGPLLDAEA